MTEICSQTTKLIRPFTYLE